jgi:hypothetical protein
MHAPYYTAICVACLALLIFSRYLINGTTIRKTLLNIKCVFGFLLQILSETFLILRIVQHDLIKVQSSCKVLIILVRF